MVAMKSLSERADALEGQQIREMGDQPLGHDNTPSSHIWRTLRQPCNAL
ncbi:MAG: hypothetical protein WD767_15405 [Alphaproteobacteria bacterium]